jgi:hypothetical protein
MERGNPRVSRRRASKPPVCDVHPHPLVHVPPPPRLPTFTNPASDLPEHRREPAVDRNAPSGAHLSVSPATTEWFEEGTRPPEPTQEPEPVPVAARRAESSRRRRQRVVITGVCALGLTVFALAALRAGRTRAADQPSVAESPTSTPAAVAQPVAAAAPAGVEAHPALPAVTPMAPVATAPHRAPPPSKADPRRTAAKRAYTPQSL